jgi:hypothetical protein
MRPRDFGVHAALQRHARTPARQFFEDQRHSSPCYASDGTSGVMDARVCFDFTTGALARQRSAIKLYGGYTLAVAIIGLALVIAAQVGIGSQNSELYKWLLTLGGTFVASLVTVPIQQIVAGRERAGALEAFATLLAVAVSKGGPLDAELQERFSRVFDKSLGV